MDDIVFCHLPWSAVGLVAVAIAFSLMVAVVGANKTIFFALDFVFIDGLLVVVVVAAVVVVALVVVLTWFGLARLRLGLVRGWLLWLA